MRKVLTALPLLASWLVVAMGTWVSLHTGLYPLLAIGMLLLWTFIVLIGLRAAISGQETWRKLLPVFLFVGTLLVYQYAFRALEKNYYDTYGPPRRYYSWDPKAN